MTPLVMSPLRRAALTLIVAAIHAGAVVASAWVPFDEITAPGDDDGWHSGLDEIAVEAVPMSVPMTPEPALALDTEPAPSEQISSALPPPVPSTKAFLAAEHADGSALHSSLPPEEIPPKSEGPIEATLEPQDTEAGARDVVAPSLDNTAQPPASSSRAGTSHVQLEQSGAGSRRYAAQVSAAINRQKHFPSEAVRRKLRGAVGLSFTIDAVGKISRAAIAESSGSDVLDAAAMRMLSSARLPSPPSGLFHGSIVIRFRNTP